MRAPCRSTAGAVRLHSPRDAAAAGIAMLPGNRKQQGVFANKSIAFNISSAHLRAPGQAGLLVRPAPGAFDRAGLPATDRHQGAGRRHRGRGALRRQPAEGRARPPARARAPRARAGGAHPGRRRRGEGGDPPLGPGAGRRRQRRSRHLDGSARGAAARRPRAGGAQGRGGAGVRARREPGRGARRRRGRRRRARHDDDHRAPSAASRAGAPQAAGARDRGPGARAHRRGRAAVGGALAGHRHVPHHRQPAEHPVHGGADRADRDRDDRRDRHRRDRRLGRQPGGRRDGGGRAARCATPGCRSCPRSPSRS